MEAYITDSMIQMWLAGAVDIETIYYTLKCETGLSDYGEFVDVFMQMAIER